jgi:hypothetical protein
MKSKKYEFDSLDLNLLAKCEIAVEYINEGDPLKDALDNSDIEDAIKLLVELGKFHGELKK